MQFTEEVLKSLESNKKENDLFFRELLEKSE